MVKKETSEQAVYCKPSRIVSEMPRPTPKSTTNGTDKRKGTGLFLTLSKLIAAIRIILSTISNIMSSFDQGRYFLPSVIFWSPPMPDQDSKSRSGRFDLPANELVEQFNASPLSSAAARTTSKTRRLMRRCSGVRPSSRPKTLRKS